MTKEQALEIVNESLIDQDSKFRREINALFKQKEVQELMQQAYDMSDDNAKMSLMDATEKQFLDKFAKDGGSGDDETGTPSDDSTDVSDFEEDGSDIDFETDGSDIETPTDTPDENGSGVGGDADPFGGDDSNPFADFGGAGDDNGGDAQQEPSNPFESSYFSKRAKSLNENHRTKKVSTGFHRKRK